MKEALKVSLADCKELVNRVRCRIRVLVSTRKVVLCLTKDYQENEWNEFIQQQVHYHAPAGRDRRLVPIRLTTDAPQLPVYWQALHVLDWTVLQKRPGDRIRFWENLRKSLMPQLPLGGRNNDYMSAPAQTSPRSHELRPATHEARPSHVTTRYVPQGQEALTSRLVPVETEWPEDIDQGRLTLTRHCFDFRAERNTDQVHTALPRMTTR